MRKAQEEYSLAQEQIENGVQANYVNFLTSFTDLRTQEKSVELANQNYDVTSNRYKNDLALLTDMLDASNMKLSADLGLVNARINVVYSFYQMKYIRPFRMLQVFGLLVIVPLFFLLKAILLYHTLPFYTLPFYTLSFWIFYSN